MQHRGEQSCGWRSTSDAGSLDTTYRNELVFLVTGKGNKYRNWDPPYRVTLPIIWRLQSMRVSIHPDEPSGNGNSLCELVIIAQPEGHLKKLAHHSYEVSRLETEKNHLNFAYSSTLSRPKARSIVRHLPSV